MSEKFLFLIVSFLLCAAAWRDLASRIIPDSFSVALAATGLLLRAMEGWQAACLSLLVALGLFALLLLPAARGFLGGGDVKLAAAVALGLSPAATWDFVFATTMIGGLLGLAYLLAPHVVPQFRPVTGAPLLWRILVAETWRLRRRGPVPYGVAIAGGGILTLLGSPGG